LPLPRLQPSAAVATPSTAGDGNGLDYVYCGQIDRQVWFPEPPVG
jgi:hypothetical protein